MRAILVCVDYADILAVTLPYNRHHFDEVWVVTTPGDFATLRVAVSGQARTFVTDAFYRDGAVFNKWRALELGLDAMGREGWLCIMDADVLWPREAPLSFKQHKLYSPLRRMYEPLVLPVPPEQRWLSFPQHRNVAEWAGYTQVFHADDPVLYKVRYWHDTDWTHAGGADSFFQQRWHKANKIRPNWEVLHLGGAGQNWCGRVSPYLDGTEPERAKERHLQLRALMHQRRTNGNYSAERLDQQPPSV